MARTDERARDVCQLDLSGPQMLEELSHITTAPVQRTPALDTAPVAQSIARRSHRWQSVTPYRIGATTPNPEIVLTSWIVRVRTAAMESWDRMRDERITLMALLEMVVNANTGVSESEVDRADELVAELGPATHRETVDAVGEH